MRLSHREGTTTAPSRTRLVRALSEQPDSFLLRGLPRRSRRFTWSRTERIDFFFACLMNQSVLADRAWTGPQRLRERLGHLDPQRIASMPVRGIERAVRGGKGGSLHRFPHRTARFLRETSCLLAEEFSGDPANMWLDGLDVVTVHQRLRQFPGIGDKIASMMIRILMEGVTTPSGHRGGANLRGLDRLDVAVDRHVARILLRLGVLPRSTGRTSFRVVKQQAIIATRRIFPPCPGALDYPLFDIGRRWCVSGRALCEGKDGSEWCPLYRVCPRDRATLNIGD